VTKRLLVTKPLKEEWTYYSLSDGMVVGLKVFPTKVLKDDETGNYELSHYVTWQFYTEAEWEQLHREIAKSGVGQ
jgi:hypothetical protein